MKDVKTKPKTIKRSPSQVKDIKTVMKNQYIWRKAAVKTQINNSPPQEQKPENYATDTIENTVYGLSDTAYHRSKSYVHNKIKKHKAEKIREKETPCTSSDTDLADGMTPQYSNTAKTRNLVHTDVELEKACRRNGGGTDNTKP